MTVKPFIGKTTKQLPEAKQLLCLRLISSCLLGLLLFIPSTNIFAQDCGSEGLVCNTNLQVSLDSDCSLGLDIDRFIENPLDGVTYQVEFFDQHSRPIDSISNEHVNQQIEFRVSCSGNSCWGTIALEANSLPTFNAPCQIKQGQPIPFRCQTWCGTDIPSVFLTLDDIQASVQDMCVPLEVLGEISEQIIREGDICEPNGEIVTIVHEAKIVTHGTIRIVELLRQAVRQTKISIDSTSLDLATILFPPTQFFNCDEGFSPEEIVTMTGSFENAYPVYLDEHNLVPDSLFRCDTFILETIIGLRDTVLPTDTIDGKVIWEQLTVIDKEFEDSIVCATQPILNPDSTVVLVPDMIPLSSRTCNLIAGFSDVSFDECANGQKIIRHWSIIDWCDSSLEITGTQIIEVTDQEAPVILEEITEFDVLLQPWSCMATATLPTILTEDNCGTVNVSWYTEEGQINGDQITDIWYDNTPVELTVVVSDNCKNTDSRTIQLNIIDDTPPVAICNTSVQVALTASADIEFDNGTAKLFATDFDEGSNDPQCGKVEVFVVRQEDWSIPVENCFGEFIGYEAQSCSASTELIDLGEGDNKSNRCEFNGLNQRAFVTQPAEFIKFCCEDVGKLIDVVFIARDEAGNTNQCMVTVLVSNENGPELICEDAVITCEDDIHLVPPPTIIEGTICPASYLPVQLSDETVNRSNCDSIRVTRTWFVDTNDDGIFGSGEPHCAQEVIITGASDVDDFELECTDIELPCTTSLEDLPRPNVIGNEFCLCDESLIKISGTQRTNNLCVQDTLFVDWYFDANDDNIFDPFESSCMQAIALTTDASMFTILCEPITVVCDQPIAEVTRPTVENTPDACLCPEEFLKLDFVEEFRNDCQQESVQRSWYIDVNQNDQREEDEESCIQEIFIDYVDPSFSLSCTDVELQCGEDPSVAIQLPEIIQNAGCSCNTIPELIFIGEQSDLNVCGIDRMTRSYFLDINGNQAVDPGEPQCDQAITINNMAQPISIDCDNAIIDCLDQIDGQFIPTIINRNTCGCTSPQLELRNAVNLDGVCFGDVITREWFVDLDGNGRFDQNEPSCTQELSVLLEEDNPRFNQSMVFNCGPTISVTCADNLDAVAAPTLTVADGFCDCDDVDVILASSTATDGVCVGDTIFRMFFADANSNGQLDDIEPRCEQQLVLVGSVFTDIVCQDQTIDCFTSLDDIPTPTVQNNGFCTCDDLQPQLITSSETGDLCFGDQFTRTFFIDVDGDNFADEDEPTCEQIISISSQNIMIDFENCDTLRISCEQDINNFPPSVNASQGICACNRDFNLTLIGGNLDQNICPGETIVREWFIDLDSDGNQDFDESGCSQVIIANDVELMNLVCESSTVSCLERNPPLNPPVIADIDNCDCEGIQVILSAEFGANDRCPGDTLFREWFADVNGNSLVDPEEPNCTQEIILIDDNAAVTFECTPIRVTCTQNIENLRAPDINVNNSCGCSNFEPQLLSDGLLNSICAGDTTTRMWYVDIDGDDFADEDEPFCLQEITILPGRPMPIDNLSDTTIINCLTDLNSLIPSPMSTSGFCDCNAALNLILLDTMEISFCVNDLFDREWVIDANNNGVADNDEQIFTQVLIVEASDESFQINCENQFADCLIEDVPALLPTVTAAAGCVCPDIQPLILQQFGAENRCVGDTLFREWYADINANSNFDEGEPTCIQNVILMDESSNLSLDCPQVNITCETVSDSIPLPAIVSESACGCMNNVLTLLTDGSIGGICFGESFTREYFLDMNSDGIPQATEANCRQIVTVAGTVGDMTFNCESQMIQCTDTLSQIAPPQINALGICTCNQFNLTIAEVSIPSSICEGDSIIQRWFADTNPNNQFDSLDVFCDQVLILEEPEEFVFNCDTVSVTCEQDLSLLVPPSFTAPGLCNCSDLDVLLLSDSPIPAMTCIGDEIIRTWYIDENEDGSFQNEETVCDQILTFVADEQSFSITCDTFFVDCTDSIAMIELPTLLPLSNCVCDSIDLVMLADDDLMLCPQDTTFRLFFGDANNDGMLSEGEPSCSQVIIVNDTPDRFDPLTIKWPASFIGESQENGVLLTCSNDTVFASRELIIGNDPMNCMPANFEPRPFWCESDCDLVSFSVVSDTVNNISSCPSILNTFTIIDWCTFDSSVTDSTEIDSDNFELVMDLAQEECNLCPIIADTLYTRFGRVDVDGFYQYTQEINIVDNEPPVVTLEQDTIIVNVTPNDMTNICSASIDVTATAVDMCNGAESDPSAIQWTIRVVDENREPVASETGEVIETRVGAMATVNSREGMPGDSLSIVWTVRDACNSVSITETQLFFVDSLSQCDTTAVENGLIGGIVKTESGQSLQGASILLNGDKMESPKTELTSSSGNYMFYNNDMEANYKLTGDKEDSHRRGVSTADVIKIYNHISTTALLDSPYKLIAADVTNDALISIEDIAEMKRLILGTQDTFANNDAWRFISDHSQFFDAANPWPFTETMEIRNFNTNLNDANFTAIKIGDVTNDALSTTESRQNHELTLYITDSFLKKEEPITVNVTLPQFDIAGLQGTISFTDLMDVELSSEKIDISNTDYNYTHNTLNYSFHKIQNKKTDLLFTLIGIPVKEGFLSEFITFNDLVTRTEVYGLDGVTYNVNIKFVTEKPSFSAGNYTPNPFSESSSIELELPTAGALNYSIYSSTGKLVNQNQVFLQAGKQMLIIKNKELAGNGFYTVVFEHNGYRLVKRVVLID